MGRQFQIIVQTNMGRQRLLVAKATYGSCLKSRKINSRIFLILVLTFKVKPTLGRSSQNTMWTRSKGNGYFSCDSERELNSNGSSRRAGDPDELPFCNPVQYWLFALSITSPPGTLIRVAQRERISWRNLKRFKFLVYV